VFAEFKRIYALEIEKRSRRQMQPTVSHVPEMLLRKGIKTHKTDKKDSKVQIPSPAPNHTKNV
jgi:hypothetical protein